MKVNNLSKSFCFAIIILLLNQFESFSQTVDFIRHYTQPNKFFQANHIIHTSDDCYVMVGHYNTLFSGGINNYFILKTNTLGDTLWYREDNFPFTSGAQFVIETSDSCYVLGTNKYPLGLVKYDKQGAFLWEKAMDPSSGLPFVFNSIVEVNQRLYAFCYAVVSPSIVNGIMIKMNLNGDTILTLNNTPFTCGESIHAAIKYGNDKIALSGFEYDSVNSIYQARLSVIDTNGSVLIEQVYPTANIASGLTISEDGNGGFYMMSEGSSGSTYKLDSSGNILWSKGVAGRYFCKIDSITLLLMNDNLTYFYLNDSGQFISYIPFDFPFTTNPTHIADLFLRGNKLIMGGSANDARECFIVQYDISNITDISKVDALKNIYLYPNPISSNNSILNIDVKNLKVKKIKIYNSLGQLLHEDNHQEIGGPIMRISIEKFQRGIYFLEILDSRDRKFSTSFIVN